MKRNFARFIIMTACIFLSFCASGCGKEDEIQKEETSTTDESPDSNNSLEEEIERIREQYAGNEMETADINDIIPKKEETSLQATEPSSPVPDEYLIEGVPILSQLPDFPTGCESVSACMLLQFNGYDIAPDAFIDEYLSKSDDFYHRNGICWGPDPYTYFIGDPRQSTSYGCMAPVIKNAIDNALGRSDWGGITDCASLNELCSTYICNDIPVMVWTSLKMEAPRPGSVWRLPDGSDYQWLSNEHCMVLVGYDESCYYFNDPNTGKTEKYEKEISERRFAAFEYQSIVIMPE